MGALRGESGGRAPLLGSLRDMERMVFESSLSTWDPFGDDTGECDLWGNLSTKTSFVYQEIFFSGKSGRNRAEGPGKGQLSPWRPFYGT
jgi:hypothetical protein